MDSREIIDAFRKLPIDERARLIEQLWHEGERGLERFPLSDAHHRLLHERIRQHQENPADIAAWDTVRDDLLRGL